MKPLAARNWSITARLVLLASLPSFIMFVVVSAALYLEGISAIRADLEERGRIVAAALAESSRYGLVSGNASYLDSAVRALVDQDRNIAAITILDAQRRVIAAGGDPGLTKDLPVFERAVRSEDPVVDLFDKSAPHVSLPGTSAPALRAGPVAGYVRVAMSAEPLVSAQRERLTLGALIVAIAAAISVFAGLWLAQSLRRPLRSAMEALRGIRQGHYDVHPDPRATGELRELQLAIAEMARGLGMKRQEMEDLVRQRTQALQEAVERAREADDEKRRLIARGNTLIEEERQRISREIHDHLNAALIVARLEAQHIAALAAQDSEEGTRKEIERTALRISGTVDSLYAAARRIVKELRPEILDTLGLRGALEEMLRQYDELHPACRFAFRAESPLPELRGPLAIAAYRLVQEALSNVVKHAEASHASVQLETRPGGERLVITVVDDGKGFDAATPKSGIGVIGMRERISACGGTMSIRSNPFGGTTVVFDLPLRSPD